MGISEWSYMVLHTLQDVFQRQLPEVVWRMEVKRNVTCSLHCNYSIAATLYKLWCMSGIGLYCTYLNQLDAQIIT
jgi:hypothetical protein